MEVREIKTKNLVVGAVLGALLMCVFWSLSDIIRNSVENNAYLVDKGVDITVNGELHRNAALSDFTFSVKKGDLVEVHIPFDTTFNGRKSMMILLYLSGMEFYLDDERIYSYGMKEFNENEMVGSGYHFIHLPVDLMARDMNIKIHVNEDNAFTSIDPIYYVDTDDSYQFFARKNAAVLFVGIFLAALGLVLGVAGALATFFDISFARLPLIGAFAFFMGLWSFSNQKTLQLFINSYELGTLLEYILLYMAPIPLLWLIYTMRKDEIGWKKWALLGILIEYITFVLVCFALHFAKIIHIPQSLVYFHIQGAAVLVMAVVLGVFMVKNKSRADMLFQLAIFILCGAIGLDLIRFNVQKYFLPNLEGLRSSILPLATLIFILILVLSYIIHLYDMLMTKTEKEMLTQLAYHDNLTELYNRAQANERFEELVESKEDYCIVSLDANGLKYINDTFGHEAGDRMLKNFATNLLVAFNKVGECFRMGGDEFMVIIRQKRLDEVGRALDKLSKLQKDGNNVAGFEFDASYGVAYSRETEGKSPEKVYSIADERMYKMKIKKHNSRTARELEMSNQEHKNE